ncbi:M36 family metallopeptidase [Actinoplanes sp. KI2]|uniref:M36 family metallopeptidase n=1 Tax=Actinoplanes sp. KI2 TaxID=2983315 RepID=UPI0021D5F7AC|nr:M36 family metallopeptidase [Actinoplanes sp. KI2]MCU7723563.1 M36 family metallopeptidase [Actinoplanes sp. KI2]
MPTVTRRMGAAAAGVVLLAGLLPAAAQAAKDQKQVPGKTQQQRLADYDSRESVGAAASAQPTAALRAAVVPSASPSAVNKLRDSLGVQGIVDVDRSTGTPRRVARLDGFLTGPSTQKPSTIALDYLAAHQDVFGLNAASVANLTLRQDYVDVEGTHHLSFVQSVGGVPVFGNGLKAHVAKNGRLIQIDGSPLKALPATAAAPRLSAAGARDAAVKDVFGASTAKATKVDAGATRKTTFSDGGNAKLVYFQAAGGPRLAWQTISVDEGYVHVVDAADGQILYRQSTVEADAGDVFYNYPGATQGGTQKTISLSKWLPNDSPRLAGNIAHVYSDINDDNVANPTEEIAPSGKRSFQFPFVDFSSTVGGKCSAAFKCSWDPKTAYSWETNRAQNAVQMYYFLGTWHDHLLAKPIGFTRTAGNFEAVDGDAVQGQSDDGANTANGLPDANHDNNANMNTPPDGISPRMQMYLFLPSARFLAGNSGDDSSVVYHEYTHGLSNRLVVDANGNSTLGDVQAGSMGEAWSDWYALDYLVGTGLEKDTATVGDVMVGKYVDGGGTIRTEPLDCTVGAPATTCPGTAAAGSGGYTYGDFGRISARGTEVHADGEIWGQTLWDLRRAIGSKKAESLITRAMELSPANPSYLDERNSILAADLVVNGGKLQKTIWKVFANRGMGYFAAAVDGDDKQPVEDFSMPPAANTPRGALTGKVTDSDSGTPVAGLTVGFGGHASGFAGDLQATTAADGSYTISGILPGTYAKVFARGAGYDQQVTTLSIPSHTVVQNWSVRKDWAASSGGGSVVSFTGPDYSPQCGPAFLIDQSQSSGWGSDVSATGQTVVLKLSGRVNISQLVINPSATCGDPATVSTGGYRVETSPDGTTWTQAAAGTFPSGTVTATTVALAAGTGTGVGYIRYTMLTTQGQDAGLCPAGQPPADASCVFLDSTELSVYGPAA